MVETQDLQASPYLEQSETGPEHGKGMAPWDLVGLAKETRAEAG